MRTHAFRSLTIVALSAVALMVAFTFSFAGCGGSGSTTTTTTVTVSNVTASVTPTPVVAGSSSQGSCVVHMSDGTTGTPNCTYVSSNTAVATINATTGAITSVAAGTAIITATSVQDVNRSGTATLTVTAAAANNVSVTVNRAAVLGENGAKTVMSGNIVVTNSGSADTAFSCTSSNANLVTMNNPTTCTYTPAATGSGDATITVAAHADNSKTATFTVHVGNWVLVGSGGVGLVDINKGTAMTQLLPGSAHCSYPSISYDATMFVCQHIGAVGEDDLLQIYQTDGTASGTTLLTAVDLMAQAGIATQSNPSLSPDGTKIVFSSPTTGGAQAVYVINTDWTGLTSLFTEAVSGVAISPVHFTPDGKKIMFENVSTMTVWIMNADGSSPQPLVSAPSNTALYSVDADGGMSTLYYSDGSNTYVEDAATGNIKTTINGSYLMGVLPNEGGILLLDGGGLSVLPADGVGAPIVLAIGSGWGSAY